MASKKEIEDKIILLTQTVSDGLDGISTAIGEGFSSLETSLAAEVQQVLDALANAGGSLDSTSALLDTLSANFSARVQQVKDGLSGNVGALKSGIEGIVNPEAPAPEPTE